jgi:RES domain-containing protein
MELYADLSGIGGLRAAGRWHSQGRRIVYLADHESSALLEMLVHMDRDFMPASYQLLRIVAPDDIAIEAVDAELAFAAVDQQRDWGSMA